MSRSSRMVDVAVRTGLLAGLWWVLVEGEPGGAALTVGALAAALGASLLLTPAIRWRLPARALLRFVPYFVGESVRGGADVARRALHPRLPIDPVLLDFETSLTTPAARALFAATVSLLPGTLSVELPAAGPLRLHVLDGGGYLPQRLHELERRVGALLEPRAPGGLNPRR